MSWQFVFNHFPFSFIDRDKAADAACKAGYMFMIWNGNVFYILDVKGIITCEPTGITIEHMY